MYIIVAVGDGGDGDPVELTGGMELQQLWIKYRKSAK